MYRESRFDFWRWKSLIFGGDLCGPESYSQQSYQAQTKEEAFSDEFSWLITTLRASSSWWAAGYWEQTGIYPYLKLKYREVLSVRSCFDSRMRSDETEVIPDLIRALLPKFTPLPSRSYRFFSWESVSNIDTWSSYELGSLGIKGQFRSGPPRNRRNIEEIGMIYWHKGQMEIAE